MGRPIKEKFFGNTNSPYSNTAQGGGTGIGGEGVASVAAVTGLTGMTFPAGPFTILAAQITAPQIPGGVKPVLTFSAVSATAGTVAVVSAGSGYTSAPTVSVLGSLSAGSGTATPVATLTSTQQNAIKGQAFITGGSAKLYDIKKQEASRRYLVKTADGQGQCKLITTATLTAGTMNIEATDTNGSKYYVRKLTARRAVLVQTTASGSFVYANNSAAGWTLGSASAGIVSISNN
jgi:hypothetical protein